jgi:hypothetical protein
MERARIYVGSQCILPYVIILLLKFRQRFNPPALLFGAMENLLLGNHHGHVCNEATTLSSAARNYIARLQVFLLNLDQLPAPPE